MANPRARLLAVLSLTIAACAAVGSRENLRDGWTSTELSQIRALSIYNLGPMPADPSNRFADDPDAVRLGRELFHDEGLSANRRVTCGTCHQGELDFSDDLPQSKGIETTARRSMTIRGMPWQDWFFWDGRKDSLWSQALGPLEDPKEHGISRTWVAQFVARRYREMYEATAGPLPEVDFARLPRHARPAVDDPRANDAWRALSPVEQQAVNEVFVNTGKSIAAFVRTLPPIPRDFDKYARALESGDPRGLARLNAEEKAGLRLFLGKAGCVACHSGPLFTDSDFHAVGVPDKGDRDRGRAEGLERLANDEFGYFSRWSDADPSRDAAPSPPPSRDAAEAAFKTPTLRGVAKRPPYMHAGQYSTLAEVLRQSRIPGSHHGDDPAHPQRLGDAELAAVEAFLRAL